MLLTWRLPPLPAANRATILWENTMQRKTATGFLAATLACLLSAAPLFAAEDHKAEALSHAQACVESAKQGDAKAAAEHAKSAKAHAEAAEKEKANAHLPAAIRELNSAIEHGQQGHAAQTGEAAQGAIAHLKAANKAF
ncbi:small metal-binding protein SmbP [Methylogaea oryzae]|nr:small metal-binding protein SmbP [Methylogaea oryzae]